MPRTGKPGRKQKNPRPKSWAYCGGYDEDEHQQPQTFDIDRPCSDESENSEKGTDDYQDQERDETLEHSVVGPSKFLLYQQSVQSPKGDISYLQKFFLMYVGGRFPLHLQEDFCGTALLCTEWLRTDPRRTAIGVDLDLEAITWCLENNVNKIGAYGCSRMYLFHGNVLQPLDARLVKYMPQDLITNIKLDEGEECSETKVELPLLVHPDSLTAELTKRSCSLSARDIVCAFNYSCCCLHKRADLVLYFKHVLSTLSQSGGIFVMDIYGGTSSECKLKLERRFPNFIYVWEQAEFDIIHRTTRISLHFHLQNQKKKLRHAFSYNWRLWSLPEIKDCLEEAGFQSVHFWIRQMPDAGEMRTSEGLSAGRDIKYEEMSTFQQGDAWNAYVVAVK